LLAGFFLLIKTGRKFSEYKKTGIINATGQGAKIFNFSLPLRVDTGTSVSDWGLGKI